MAATVVEYVILDERHRADMKPAPKLRAGDVMDIVLRHADGTVESVSLPPSLARAVHRLLDRVHAGSQVAVLEEEREVSPNDAARILGISRPLVVRRMDSGELPFRYEGSHRRCKLRDVLALKERAEREDRRLRTVGLMAR